jgi:hypothetical protein
VFHALTVYPPLFTFNKLPEKIVTVPLISAIKGPSGLIIFTEPESNTNGARNELPVLTSNPTPAPNVLMLPGPETEPNNIKSLPLPSFIINLEPEPKVNDAPPSIVNWSIARGVLLLTVTALGFLIVVELPVTSGNVEVAIIQVPPPFVENSQVDGVVQLPDNRDLQSSFAENEMFETRILMRNKLKINFFIV